MSDLNEVHSEFRVEEGREFNDVQCEAEFNVEIDVTLNTAQAKGQMKVRGSSADVMSLLKWLYLPALGVGLLAAAGWMMVGG